MLIITIFTVVAATLNGQSSYIDMKINSSLLPFGDNGFFEFRTRDETATLMYIQFYNNELLNASLEFGLYETNLDISLTSTNCKFLCPNFLNMIIS